MDTTRLRDAYDALLDAATTVLGPDGTGAAPPVGEWDATQVLAHIASVDAGVLATAWSVAAGVPAAFDNTASLDTATLAHLTATTGEGLRDRIRSQGEALCALAATLTESELDTPVPTLLSSAGVVQVDQAVPLGGLIAGLADDHLPRHTAQLLALA